MGPAYIESHDTTSRDATNHDATVAGNSGGGGGGGQTADTFLLTAAALCKEATLTPLTSLINKLAGDYTARQMMDRMDLASEEVEGGGQVSDAMDVDVESAGGSSPSPSSGASVSFEKDVVIRRDPTGRFPFRPMRWL